MCKETWIHNIKFITWNCCYMSLVFEFSASSVSKITFLKVTDWWRKNHLHASVQARPTGVSWVRMQVITL